MVRGRWLTRRARAKGLWTLAVGRGGEDGGSMVVWRQGWLPIWRSCCLVECEKVVTEAIRG